MPNQGTFAPGTLIERRAKADGIERLYIHRLSSSGWYESFYSTDEGLTWTLERASQLVNDKD